MEYESVIGLEIHAQLSTKTKLFCGCDNDAFGAEPNTRVCPVCMGFPGVLPVLSDAALEKARLAGVALGATLREHSKFDRKNYFYPDLPSGYQISQYDEPFSEHGEVTFSVEGKHHTVRILRVHLENDAGKLTHTKDGTFLDFNRAGTPLVEIVTQPDIRSAQEAQLFAKEVQRILRHIGASDADMEKGMMRFDASVSLRPKGEKKLYPRTEIKNLNSFTSLQKAIAYEIKRQTKDWEAGNPQQSETTVGWVDDAEKTVLLRDKESAHDYRYFPEPDLPPLSVTQDMMETYKERVGELPLARRERYEKDYGMNAENALCLTDEPKLVAFFEAAIAEGADPKPASNLLLSVVLADAGWRGSSLTAQHLIDTCALLKAGKISSSGAKEIIATAMQTGDSAQDIMDQKGLEQVSDTGELEKWVDEVIAEFPDTIAEYKDGKEKALQFLIGQVMKRSRGSANPPMVMEMMKQKLA